MTESEQEQLFQLWLKDHRALLFKVTKAYAKNAVDQDDLFQEICIQVWQSAGSFRGQSKETSWLYRVALNTAITWSGRSKKRATREPSYAQMPQVLSINEEATNERLDWIYAQIRQMNQIDRSLTLLLLDGFSYREMARLLGISESNVGVKINRIKKRLLARSIKLSTHGI